MSERELNRVEILAQVDDGRLSVDNAANMLDLTRRQIFRLLKRYRQNGASALRHKSRGRSPNNQIHTATRDFASSVIKEQYPDFGPTLAAEMLSEHHGLTVSRETVRKWMVEDGLWLSSKQRRQFHQPRLRRDCYGELFQINGSDHRWFEDRAPPCTLLVFINDATSTLMELRFVKSESTFSYSEALERYLQTHGRPVAFYSDKHTVFRATSSTASPRKTRRTASCFRATVSLRRWVGAGPAAIFEVSAAPAPARSTFFCSVIKHLEYPLWSGLKRCLKNSRAGDKFHVWFAISINLVWGHQTMG